MPVEIVVLCKLLVTDVAFMLAQSTMCQQVTVQITLLSKPVVTHIAFVWPQGTV